jgi:outer membrane receptor protein involved in Fe transport
MAGASFMSTIDRLEQRFVAAETGQYGWGRLAGGGSMVLGDGELTALGQLKTYDGPWQRPEALRHGSLWAKYVQTLPWGVMKVSLSGYEASWDPTEQAPEIAVGTAACPSAYCSLDRTATGHTTRWILNGQLIGSRWQASAYAQFYDWDMFSDPTYDYQIHQFDRRWTAGARGEATLLNIERFDLRAGGELRHDDIARVGVHHSDAARFVANISDNSVREDSAAAFVEGSWRPGERWRFTAGLRGDAYHFDVGLNPGASAASSSGAASSQQASPKLGAAYTLNEHLEFYANWGQGYHSNDARGVVNAAAAVPGLVLGTGYEGGARLEIGSLKLTAAYWWLNLSSELVFVGDSNAVEPKAGARREGYELTAFWRPVEWLGLDAVYTRSKARYRDLQQDPDYVAGDPVRGLLEGHSVEGSVSSAGEFGASALKGPWEASARLRYLGSYPLVPSGTRSASAELMLNLRLGYKAGRYTWYGEVLNVMDEHGKDIVYFYPSYVPGLTPVGTEVPTRMSRAEEPRTVRLGVKVAL